MRPGSEITLQTTEHRRYVARNEPLNTVWLKQRWQTIAAVTRWRAVLYVYWHVNKRRLYLLSLPAFWVATLPQVGGHARLTIVIVSLLAWFYAGLYGWYTKKL